MTQFDRGELNDEEAEASVIAEYEARIAALERKVGQLTMELDLVKKTPRQHPVSDSEKSFIITGPKPALSDGGAKLSTSQEARFITDRRQKLCSSPTLN